MAIDGSDGERRWHMRFGNDVPSNKWSDSVIGEYNGGIGYKGECGTVVYIYLFVPAHDSGMARL
jgi:outer membrane protein assembly factor BamB